MRLRSVLLLAVVFALATAATGFAQRPGEIFGKATDTSGGVMPGVTVTLTGASLLQPMVATTGATGTYRFPGLGVGVYTIRFELTGFKIFVRDAVRLESGASVQINSALEISQLQETVTVTGETPVVDLRDTSKTARFTQEALQNIPSARDPWVIIEQSPGVAMDRQNVGGSASGQQSNFVARGSAMSQQKWNLDGIDITDLSATGGSPVYFDFDAFEEMQVTAGGSDVSMMSPGVSVNLITKSGTDKLKGSGRFYVTPEKFESNNLTDALRRSGATSGNPIQDIRDYGIEAGGPIKTGRAWFWGSYGKQDVKVGINGFYLTDTACLAVKAAPLNYTIDQIRSCLNTDQTVLTTYNAKVAVQTFKNNQFSFYFNGNQKYRNARDASDTRPGETTYIQQGVQNDALGSPYWKTGMPKTYKWSDRQILSDKFMVEFSYTHVGNNFVLDFHDPSLASVQPSYDVPTGVWGRSYQQTVYVRPTDSIDVSANYFLPGFLGGDHTFKFGGKVRNDIAHTENQWGGSGYVRYNASKNVIGTTTEAQMYRPYQVEYKEMNRGLYFQDTYSRKKLTLNLGFRFDYQNDQSNPAAMKAHPFQGQMTGSGVPFTWLPAISYPSIDSDVQLKDITPRVGLTYDLLGNGKTVAKFNYAMYASQRGTGDFSSTYNPVGSTYVRFPWKDLNGDGIATANEIFPLNPTTGAVNVLSSGGNYNPDNPNFVGVTNKNDPNAKNGYTHEIIVGIDRQIGPDFGVGFSYIWRKYGNFFSSRRFTTTPGDFTSANYAALVYTPPASACVNPGARCEAVTYYQPNVNYPSSYVYGNLPDYNRSYQGFELSVRKRMSNRWMMNGGFAYNNAILHYDSAAAYQDPTNISMLNGAQFAEESTSSGLDNVFVNAKWTFKLSGAYTLPLWDIGVAGFFNARNGYPFEAAILTPSRLNRAGTATVILDKVGDNRLPNFSTVDFRVDKTFKFNRVRIMASMDVFNLLNGNTTLAKSRTMNAPNGDLIKSILAPRVMRFGFRVTF
ncbi:MAG TPA: TonB-dependent receptor [Vicinamibacterales bacterium]|jgi:hypothetical protein